MGKLKFLIALIIYLLFRKEVHAQVNNELLSQKIEVNDSLEKQVLLSVSNQNFLKNNEYFHDITTGYTLFGSMLSTQVAYLPTKNLRIQAGVFFRKDFGNNQLQTIEPLLTLKYQKNNFSVLAGNIEGNVSHQLIEPIYNYERFITNYNENGLQVKFANKKIWTDTWINWEVMEYNKSDYQEQFSAGNSSKIVGFSSKNNTLEFPLQILFTHRGGQIDVDSSEVQSKCNLALGFNYTHRFDGIVRKISTQNYFTYYTEFAPSENTLIKNGKGIYLNALLETKYAVNLMLNYWNGNNYLAPRGGELYQSLSSVYAQKSFVQANRQLLLMRLFYQKKIVDGFNVDIRFEPYYDLGNQFLEYSYSIYLTYKKDFGLFNEKYKRKN